MLHITETGIRSGLMSPLACMQIICLKVSRIRYHLWVNVFLMLLEQVTASALEIDFGTLSASLNCVPLHKRLDISADGIHVCILNTVFLELGIN